jgi:hypothetical protein
MLPYALQPTKQMLPISGRTVLIAGFVRGVAVPRVLLDENLAAPPRHFFGSCSRILYSSLYTSIF